MPNYQAIKQEKDNILPDLTVGETVTSVDIEQKQHFTQPPARFSEATLIKTLEENGVGRPSTYAPTLETIQRRYYVKLAQKERLSIPLLLISFHKLLIFTLRLKWNVI